jgi:hypothetical protein
MDTMQEKEQERERQAESLTAPVGRTPVLLDLEGRADPSTYDTDRVTLAWQGGEPPRSCRSVSGTIGAFSTKSLPPDAWERIQAFVRTAVTMADPETPFIAEHQLSVVAQLAAWADRLCIPLDPRVLFQPETLDRFLLEGAAHLSDGSRLNYGTHLWKVGAAMLGHDLFPSKPLPLKRSEPSAPYSSTEVIELVSWARGLPTAHMRRNARALLAIGLGVGLTSNEIQRLVGTDVRRVGNSVVVQVTGKAPRDVPVLDLWAEEIWRPAQESGARPFFCPERRRITRRDVIGFIERCSGDDAARFNVQRLRVTWIVHHLSVGTHLLSFEAMAGVGAGQLVKYLRFASVEAEHSVLIPSPARSDRPRADPGHPRGTGVQGSP